MLYKSSELITFLVAACGVEEDPRRKDIGNPTGVPLRFTLKVEGEGWGSGSAAVDQGFSNLLAVEGLFQTLLSLESEASTLHLL